MTIEDAVRPQHDRGAGQLVLAVAAVAAVALLLWVVYFTVLPFAVGLVALLAGSVVGWIGHLLGLRRKGRAAVVTYGNRSRHSMPQGETGTTMPEPDPTATFAHQGAPDKATVPARPNHVPPVQRIAEARGSEPRTPPRRPSDNRRTPEPVQPPSVSTAETIKIPLPKVVTTVELVEIDGGSDAGRRDWRMPDHSAQSGVAMDSAQLGDLEVRAASVVGPSHRCVAPADPRQDAYSMLQAVSGRYLVIAVADGVSNKKHSELGARVAVTAAGRLLVARLATTRPERIDTTELFSMVAGEMIGTAENRGIDRGQVACLLVVAVVPTAPEPDGSRRVWTAQVGDVSVWVNGNAGLTRRTGAVKAGLDPNSLQAVLPTAPGVVVAETLVLQKGQGLAVMTDGLGDVLENVSGADVFYARRWARPPTPVGFLADLMADARGQLDDRTAVVIWTGAS